MNASAGETDWIVAFAGELLAAAPDINHLQGGALAGAHLLDTINSRNMPLELDFHDKMDDFNMLFLKNQVLFRGGRRT